MSQARVLQLCDAVASLIGSLWTPTAPDAVQRAYGPDVGLTEDDPSTLITGRQVYVFPVSYGVPTMIDRSELDHRDTVAVLVIERYTAGTGYPPVDWMDARVNFTEQKIFIPLRNPQLVLLDTLIPDLETPGSVDVVYDIDLYRDNKTFWSQLTLPFQEVAT